MRFCQKGFSLVEVLVIVVVIVIIAVLALPHMLMSRMTAAETSAVGSLRTLNTALGTYSSQYNTGYPTTLSQLAPAAHPTATAADLTDGLLASGMKSGYAFAYATGVADAKGVINTFTLRANPVVPGQTGTRYFFTDQTGVVTFAFGRTAGPTDVPF